MKPEQTYTRGEIVRFYPFGKNHPNSRKVVEILEVKKIYTGTKVYRIDVAKLFPTFVFSSALEKIPKFIVLAGSITIHETNDRNEALKVMRAAHKKDYTKYHEVHEFNVMNDNLYYGTDQLEPYDCSVCSRSPAYCQCEKKVNLPKNWESHEDWANRMTIESLKELRKKGEKETTITTKISN